MARWPLRIPVIRLVGTLSRRANSDALIPSAPNSSAKCSPGCIALMGINNLLVSDSPQSQHSLAQAIGRAIRNTHATDRLLVYYTALCVFPLELQIDYRAKRRDPVSMSLLQDDQVSIAPDAQYRRTL